MTMQVEIHDPRPNNMAELARLTAIELRKRPNALHVAVLFLEEPTTLYVPRPIKAKLQHADAWRFPQLYWAPYRITDSQFDNLGPIACANVIQAEESRKAREWAGDK